jgi:hypothetical protein
MQCTSVYWGTGRTRENDVKPQDNHTAGKIALSITNQSRKDKKNYILRLQETDCYGSYLTSQFMLPRRS